MQALLATVVDGVVVGFLLAVLGAIGLRRHARVVGAVPEGIVLAMLGLAARRQRGRHGYRHPLPAQQQRE